MKKLLFIWLLSGYTFILSAQNGVTDSSEVIKLLQPFEKYLDNELEYSNGENLLNSIDLFRNTSDIYESKDLLEDKNIPFKFPKTYSSRTEYEIAKAKYGKDQLLLNDSNNIPWVEVEYDLSNRNLLNNLKYEYKKTKDLVKKHNILIEYIEELGKVYPKRKDVQKFSYSNTVNKYLRQCIVLTNQMKNDINLAYCLIYRAREMMSLDESVFKMGSITDLLMAEKIILSPFLKLGNKIINNSDSNIKYYNQFILKDKKSICLPGIYNLMVDCLWPDEKYININNELYPFIEKGLYYSRLVCSFYKCFYDSLKKYRGSYENAEEAYLLTSGFTRRIPNSIYNSRTDVQTQRTLQFYLKDLLKSSPSMSAKRLSYMYFALGQIFEKYDKPLYALKAFYKSLEYKIKSSGGIKKDIYNELLFNQIFEVANSLKKIAQQKNDWLENLNYVEKIYRKFEECYVDDATSIDQYRAVSLRTFVSMKKWQGEESQMKDYLCYLKFTFSKDSFNTNVRETDILYGLLYENGWLTANANPTSLVEKADSAYFEIYSGHSKSSFDDNEFIPDLLSSITQLESTSWSRYEQNKLNSEIAKGEAKITKLQTEYSKLGKANKKLVDNIILKNKDLLNISLEFKTQQARTIKLQKSFVGLIKDTTNLNKVVNSKNKEIATKERTIFWMLVSVIATFLIFLIFLAFALLILRKKRRQIEAANKELTALGETKIVLEKDVSYLNSIILANKLQHESDLKYENEKVIREHVLKHEIVGMFRNLYADVEYLDHISKENRDDFVSKIDEFKHKFKNLTAFAKLYYETLDQRQYNTLEKEIELARMYIDFISQNWRTSSVKFSDQRQYKNLDIVLPHHLINQFTKNSLEKGKISDRTLNIQIRDQIDKEHYILSVVDDGVGIGENFSLEQLNANSTGLRSILKQIELYNSKNDFHQILFNSSSFINRKSFDGHTGTIVTLKIKKKTNHEIFA